MKSHMVLLRTLLNELGKECCTSTSLDLKKIEARVEHEGLSFYTITLPAFGKDFERSLDKGMVDSSVFCGYEKTGRLPRLLSGFVSQVFDSRTGIILDDPSIAAIRAVRQATGLFSKLELPCAEHRVKAAFDGYIQCDTEVGRWESSVPPEFLREFEKVSHALFHEVFLEMEFLLLEGDLVPKHGPGATADKLMGNQKFVQTEWPDRLETVFPHWEYLIPNQRFDAGILHFLSPEQERPVRVITVPKTMKTPRIIAVEPTCMQYTQQALLERYVEVVGSKLPGQFIGFDDQEPNRNLALKGSLTGKLATLDLSEASDRVSNLLVQSMVSRYPLFAEALDATRSRRADVPGHGVVSISKYSSMGSALCFPIEASVFLTLVIMGISRSAGSPVTPKFLRGLRGRVRIFGDDIIVPSDTVLSVIETLEAYGLKVNHNKSFWTGNFRESCGKEYYKGHDVSIVKFRREFPTSRQHVQEIISLVSFRNQLYNAGLWETCKWVDNMVEGLIPFPTVLPTSPVLGRHSFLGYESEKMCPYLHRDLVRGAMVVSKIPKSDLGDIGALLKFFLKRGDDPSFDKNHLRRAGRPDSVDIKIGYGPSY